MTGKHCRGWIAVVLVIAALTAPAAQAMHAPNDTATPSRPTATLAGDDRLGPKYVQVAKHVATPTSIGTIEVVKPSGFVWGDALIGAGVTALAIALLGAVTLGVTRRRVTATTAR
jgi:hypothetical protein